MLGQQKEEHQWGGDQSDAHFVAEVEQINEAIHNRVMQIRASLNFHNEELQTLLMLKHSHQMLVRQFQQLPRMRQPDHHHDAGNKSYLPQQYWHDPCQAEKPEIKVLDNDESDLSIGNRAGFNDDYPKLNLNFEEYGN